LRHRHRGRDIEEQRIVCGWTACHRRRDSCGSAAGARSVLLQMHTADCARLTEQSVERVRSCSRSARVSSANSRLLAQIGPRPGWAPERSMRRVSAGLKEGNAAYVESRHARRAVPRCAGWNTRRKEQTHIQGTHRILESARIENRWSSAASDMLLTNPDMNRGAV